MEVDVLITKFHKKMSAKDILNCQPNYFTHSFNHLIFHKVHY